MSISPPSQQSRIMSTPTSTMMKVVNSMAIPILYYDFDYRDMSITLDSAAKASQSSCQDVFESSLDRFIASEFAIGAITTGGYYTFCASIGLTDTLCNTGQTTYGTLLYVFPFQPSPPCCNRCSITAGDIQVYHWPLSTVNLSFSTLVNSNNFTFIYPSVYVAIQTLEAYDLCGSVGTEMKSIPTIGFDATDLSTAASYWFPPGWDFLGGGRIYGTWCTYSGLNLQTSIGCTDITTTVYWLNYLASTIPTPSTYVDTRINSTFTFTPVAATYNPCTPYLSVPSPLLTLDPRWSSCVRYMAGLHDPPITLNPANGFYPITTTSAPAPANPTKTNGPAAPQAFQQFSASKTSLQATTVARSDPLLPSIFISKLPAMMSFKGSSITAGSGSEFVIDSDTLAPGGQITVSGTLLSMARDGLTVVIDNTRTQFLDPIYVAGTQTFSAGGPAVTISGAQVTVQSGGRSMVIVGSTTEDISVLLGGPTPSVGGSGGPQTKNPSPVPGVAFDSASRRTEYKNAFRWQLVLLIIVIYGSFR